MQRAVPGAREAFAREAANVVDRAGRALILKDSALSRCEQTRNVLRTIDLKTRIVDARVFCAELLAVDALRWLVALEKASDALRRVISACLVNEVATILPAGASTAEADLAVAGGLAGNGSGGRPPVAEQFLINFTKLWKEARAEARNVLLGGLLIEADFKRYLARMFTAHYTDIHEEGAHDDEHGTEAMATLSVQLYTVPSISRWLVQEHNALHILCSFLHHLLISAQNAGGLLVCDDPSNTLSTREYASVLLDLSYVLRCDVGSLVPHLQAFLDIFGLMQGMDPHVRRVGHHVEHESEGWANAIVLAYQVIATVLPHLLQGCSRFMSESQSSVRQTLTAIANSVHGVSLPLTHNICETGVRSIAFDVAEQPVSVHIPLHRFLAALLTRAATLGLTLSDALQLDSWPLHDPVGLVLSLLEFPLRVQVMHAQVRAKLWVRNGFPVPNIFHNYNRRDTIGEHFFDQDIVLHQVAAVLLGPDHFVQVVLDRFNLVRWFQDFDSKELSPDMHSRTMVIVEDLLNLLIFVAGERYIEGVSHVTVDEIARREIVHKLCLGPAPYSDFQKHLGRRIVQHPTFDDILREEAHFHEQQGGDQGATYALKPSSHPQFNEFFYHYTARQRSQAEEAMAAVTKDAYLPPPPPPRPTLAFASLRGFTTSAAVLRLIHVILMRAGGGWDAAAQLWQDRDHNLVNERMVRQALHLLTLAFLDNSETVETTQLVVRLMESVHHGVPLPRVLLRLQLVPFWLTSGGRHRFGARLEWLLASFRHVSNPDVRVGLEVMGLASTAVVTTSAATSDLAARRAQLKAKAKARQQRLMANFSAQQSSFMQSQQPMDTSPEPSLGLVPSEGEAAEENEARSGFAVATVASPIVADELTCVTCQENKDETLILLAFAQPSTVLKRPGTTPSMAANKHGAPQQYLSAHSPQLHVGACGHVLHVKCYEQRLAALRHEIQLAMLFRQIIERPFDEELYCPLCNTLSNIALPYILLPPLPTAVAATDSTATLATDLAEVHRFLTTRQPIDVPALGSELAAMVYPSGDVRVGNEEDGNPTVTLDADVLQMVENCHTQLQRQLDAGLTVDHLEPALRPVLLANALAYSVKLLELSTRHGESPPHNSALLISSHLSTLRAAALLSDRHTCSILPVLRALVFPGPDEIGAVVPALSSDPLILFVRGLPMASLGGPVRLRAWTGVLLLLSHLGNLVKVALDADAVDDAMTAMDTETDAIDSVTEPWRGYLDELTALKVIPPIPSGRQQALCREAVQRTVPFLRSVVMLLQAGRQPPAADVLVPTEYGSLCIMAGLANGPDYFDFASLDAACDLLQYWAQQYLHAKGAAVIPFEATVHLPQLISLPPDFGDLFHAACQHVCARTNGLSVRPALCLVCGSYVCAQSPCCQATVRRGSRQVFTGACTAHAHRLVFWLEGEAGFVLARAQAYLDKWV